MLPFDVISPSAIIVDVEVTAPVTPNVEPSNVRLDSPLTVEESTEVMILLLPEFVYDDIAAAGRFVKPLPSPTIFVASTLPKDPVEVIEPLTFPVISKLPLLVI